MVKGDRRRSNSSSKFAAGRKKDTPHLRVEEPISSTSGRSALISRSVSRLITTTGSIELLKSVFRVEEGNKDQTFLERVTDGRAISPLGLLLIFFLILSYLGAILLGWIELSYLASALLMVLFISLLQLRRRPSLTVEISMSPSQAVVGSTFVGQLFVRNLTSKATSGVDVNLKVKDTITTFEIESLAPATSTSSIFTIPTSRRGVITVGPAEVSIGDSIGFFSRIKEAAPSKELIVYPKICDLPSFGQGIIRDLE